MITVQCSLCGKDIDCYPSRIKSSKHYYCCPEHQNLARRKRVQLVCDHCGKSFERTPSCIRDTANYCSPECAYAARALDPGEPPLCACGCGKPVKSFRNGAWSRYIHGHNFQGQHHSNETRTQLSEIGLRMSQERAERIRGIKNPLWRNGHSAIYGAERTESGFNSYQRRRTRERLETERGHICERCGATDKPLELHHIDHDLFHNDDDNLLLCCHSCQMKYTAEFVAQTS